MLVDVVIYDVPYSLTTFNQTWHIYCREMFLNVSIHQLHLHCRIEAFVLAAFQVHLSNEFHQYVLWNSFRSRATWSDEWPSLIDKNRTAIIDIIIYEIVNIYTYSYIVKPQKVFKFYQLSKWLVYTSSIHLHICNKNTLSNVFWCLLLQEIVAAYISFTILCIRDIHKTQNLVFNLYLYVTVRSPCKHKIFEELS